VPPWNTTSAVPLLAGAPAGLQLPPVVQLSSIPSPFHVDVAAPPTVVPKNTNPTIHSPCGKNFHGIIAPRSSRGFFGQMPQFNPEIPAMHEKSQAYLASWRHFLSRSPSESSAPPTLRGIDVARADPPTQTAPAKSVRAPRSAHRCLHRWPRD